MREFVELCATVVEVAGVAAIAGGLVLATLRLARAPAARATRYAGYRRDLARTVVIRIFSSWSLTLELEGRWPWQRPLHTPIP